MSDEEPPIWQKTANLADEWADDPDSVADIVFQGTEMGFHTYPARDQIGFPTALHAAFHKATEELHLHRQLVEDAQGSSTPEDFAETLRRQFEDLIGTRWFLERLVEEFEEQVRMMEDEYEIEGGDGDE